MYQLPKDFEISSLAGSKLYEIAFNANQIRLMFDSRVNIVVEGRMVMESSSISSDSTDSGLNITAQAPTIKLLDLIESQVVSIQIDEQRLNLKFTFSKGQTLTLIGNEPYECYTVHIGDKAIIV